MSSLRNPENKTDSVKSPTLKGYDVCSSVGEPYAAKSLIFSDMMPGVYIKCSDKYYTLVQRFVRLVLSPETAVGFLQGWRPFLLIYSMLVAHILTLKIDIEIEVKCIDCRY